VDSLTQVALGAAVGAATMGRRTAVWKSVLWGAFCGTLPDLDALIDHGNPVLNMTEHRSESHALFWLTLVAPLLAFAIAALHRELDRFRRWWLAIWLVLITHPLLDAMTVYGTRLALPFEDRPFGVGSVFIIDPLYTLPLLIGLIVTLSRRGPRRWRANLIGLTLSTAYLGWSMVAQAIVEEQVREALVAQHGAEGRAFPVLVTPTAFNTILWRIVVMRDEHYDEAFVSLLDRGRPPRMESFERGKELYEQTRDIPAVQRMAWFTWGFFRMREREGRIELTDLRMGQEPYYSFSFVVGERTDERPDERTDEGRVEGPDSRSIRAAAPISVGGREGMDLRASLNWLWRRALGEDIVLSQPRAS
jgi:inner membrane protein